MNKKENKMNKIKLLAIAIAFSIAPLAYGDVAVSCDEGETYGVYTLEELYSIGSPCSQMSSGVSDMHGYSHHELISIGSPVSQESSGIRPIACSLQELHSAGECPSDYPRAYPWEAI